MEQAPAKRRGLLSTAANGLAMEVGYILGGWFSALFNDLAESSSPSTRSWRSPVRHDQTEPATRAHRRHHQFVINLIPCIAARVVQEQGPFFCGGGALPYRQTSEFYFNYI